MRTFLIFLTFGCMALGHTACEEPDRAIAVCGNAVLESGEDCDRNRIADLFSWFCRDWGYNDGAVACSSSCRLDLSACEASGRCGDGQITAGFETCDGTNFGGATCESLGDHGGELTCTPDCRVDRSGCASCGDGVLQPEYGELVEVDFDGCARTGHFGGVITTYDCRVASERMCGDYRLITGPGSVKGAVPAFDDARELWVAGIVQGAFLNFENPGCPHLEPMAWESYGMDGWEQHRDGYYYPLCDDHFLGTLPEASPLDAKMQAPDHAAPQALLNLGSRGFAQVRHDPESDTGVFVVEWISPQGARLHRETLSHHAGRGEPQLVAASEGEFALVTFSDTESVVAISRFSVDPPGRIATGELQELEFGGQRYVPNPYSSAVRAIGVTAGVYQVFASLKEAFSDPMVRGDFLMTVEVDEAEVRVLEVLALDLPGSTWVLMNPIGETGELELVWASWDGEVADVHAARLDPAGTPLSHTEFRLPSDHHAWTAHRLPGGDWIVGGLASSREPLAPVTTPCDGYTSQTGQAYLFASRYSPYGVLQSQRYFASPSFQFYPYRDEPRERACQIAQVRTLPDGEAILFAGTWDRSEFFCSSQEPVLSHQLEPVHACGVYLVRLEP